MTPRAALQAKLTEFDTAVRTYCESSSNWIQQRTEVSDKLTPTEALLKICEREIQTGRALLPLD